MLFPKIEKIIHTLDDSKITKERKTILEPFIEYLQGKMLKNEMLRLNFICTHNSRRSHFAQIWTEAIAYYFQMSFIKCYSGGTEATAVYPTVVEIFKKQGFEIKKLTKSGNPVFAVKFAENAHPVIAFSKVYDDFFNPRSGFAAIMSCSDADEACPFVAGAEDRFSIPYEDPKEFDGSNREIEMYSERSLQIASEMFYVFSKIKR